MFVFFFRERRKKKSWFVVVVLLLHVDLYTFCDLIATDVRFVGCDLVATQKRNRSSSFPPTAVYVPLVGCGSLTVVCRRRTGCVCKVWHAIHTCCCLP